MSTIPLAELGSSYYEASCAGKERHATEAAARAALSFYQASKQLRSGTLLDIYRCQFCQEWHAGHKRPWLGTRNFRVG